MKPIDNNTDIFAYFQSLSELQFETLSKFRRTLRERMPEATEHIYYQMPTFVLEKQVIAYAAFKAHWGLFPCSGSVIPQLADQIGSYKWTKSGIQFPYANFPSDDLLDDIIRLKKTEISESLQKKLLKTTNAQK